MLDNIRPRSIRSGRVPMKHCSMKPGAINSRAQSLQILKHDLCKLALEKHAAELKDASAEKRDEILAQIDRDIQKEMKRRARMPHMNDLLY